MDLETMRDELRLHLGVDAQELDDPDANLLLNSSYFEIDNKFPFREKEALLNFTTTDEEPKYQFNAGFESIVTVSITDPDTNQKSVLERMTKTDYENNLNTDDDYHGPPCYYVRDGNCIILYPTPDAEYSITIRYKKLLAELVNDADEADVPRVWYEIIVFGAVWRGFVKLGDFNRADRIKAHQVALITSTVPTESKEEFDTHTGGVIVHGRASPRRRR